MKKLILSGLLFVLLASTLSAQSNYDDAEYFGDNRVRDNRTGYDGDFFSLEGALEVFKQSRSIQDFERRLNRQNSYVNNLDLDGDGRTDYIRVEHRVQGDFHAIILQAPFSRNDVQDIAVIEMERIGRRNVILQIVGDEDLYGEEVVVEPFEGDRYVYREDAINVYNWRPVRNIFAPAYRPYISPYYYAAYPTWWSPWRPLGWNVFRPRIVIFHRHFFRARRHRLVHVHTFYRPFRCYSVNVFQRRNQVRGRRGLAPVRRNHVAATNNRNAARAKAPNRNRINNQGTTASRNRINNKSTASARTRTDKSARNSTRNRAIEPNRQSTRTKTNRATTRQTPSESRTKSTRQRSTQTQRQASPSRSQKSASSSRSSRVQSSPSRSSANRSSASSRSKSSSSSARSSRSSASKSNRSSASRSSSSRSSKSSAKRSTPSRSKSSSRSSSRSSKSSKSSKRGSRN